jgi:hypothetical protein
MKLNLEIDFAYPVCHTNKLKINGIDADLEDFVYIETIPYSDTGDPDCRRDGLVYKLKPSPSYPENIEFKKYFEEKYKVDSEVIYDYFNLIRSLLDGVEQGCCGACA